MFWLFDEQLKPSYEFFTIHYGNTIEIDDNMVYNLGFEMDSSIESETKSETKQDIIPDPKSISDIVPITFRFEVKIMGQLISWTDLDTKKTVTFTKKEQFIEPDSNSYSKPVFNYNYKPTDNHRLPNILAKSYDFYYKEIILNVYVLNQNTFFIKEQIKIEEPELSEELGSLITKTESGSESYSNYNLRKYWITPNLKTKLVC